MFYDSVWNNFDKTTLGNADLDYLYKLRALQLREEYDYLVLYFSSDIKHGISWRKIKRYIIM
jgi:hypothetical protein